MRIGSYQGAISILRDTQNNVGIGTSAGQKIQGAISDLEKEPSTEKAIDLLAKKITELGWSLETTKQEVKREQDARSALGESLETTKQLVQAEKNARKGSNAVAILAIVVTFLTCIPSYLTYWGNDPNNGFQSSLIDAITGLKQAIAEGRPSVVDCTPKSSPVIPGSKSVSR